MSSDSDRFLEISEQFFSAIVEDVPSWIQRLAATLSGESSLPLLDDTAELSALWVRDQLDLMLATEPAELRTNPLSILRSATRFLSEDLSRAGIGEPLRDPFLVEQFPGDVYNLNPASFAEVRERLGPMGIAWGAARAYLHHSEHQ